MAESIMSINNVLSIKLHRKIKNLFSNYYKEDRETLIDFNNQCRINSGGFVIRHQFKEQPLNFLISNKIFQSINKETCFISILSTSDYRTEILPIANNYLIVQGDYSEELRIFRTFTEVLTYLTMVCDIYYDER